MKQKRAYTLGKLMIANDKLEKDEIVVKELMESMKQIVPPHLFKAMARSLYIDMDDPEHRKFGPAKESPFDAHYESIALAIERQRQPTPTPFRCLCFSPCLPQGEKRPWAEAPRASDVPTEVGHGGSFGRTPGSLCRCQD